VITKMVMISFDHYRRVKEHEILMKKVTKKTLTIASGSCIMKCGKSHTFLTKIGVSDE